MKSVGKTNKKYNNAFTIIELIIVIVVIAILATLTIVLYGNIRKQADISRIKQDLSSVKKQLEVLKLNSPDEKYPVSSANLKISPGDSLQYTYTSASNTYCVTITSGSDEWYINTNGEAISGVCSGHTSVTGTPPPDPIVSSGLIAWWPLNGDATDLSSNHYNGTLMNGPTPAVGQDGQANQAIAFDGVDDYIDLGDILNGQSYPITVSGWVYRRGSTETSLLITDNSPDYNGFRFMANGNNAGYAQIGSGGSAGPGSRLSSWSPNGSITNSAWNFVVLQINGPTDMYHYINGVSKSMTYSGYGSSTAAWSADHATIGYLDNSSTQHYYTSDILDDIRVYNRILTPSEITQLYSAGAK